MLYRLAKSEFADRFILKGAAMLLVWMGDAIRPTKDIDLLGFGDTSAAGLQRVFVAICEVDAPDDGLMFVADTVRVEAIREGQEYGGMRITLMAMLGRKLAELGLWRLRAGLAKRNCVSSSTQPIALKLLATKPAMASRRRHRQWIR